MDTNQDTLTHIVKLMTSIETLETVYTILRQIKERCLVKTYREARSLSKASPSRKEKFITSKSFLGQYVEKCLLKMEIGGFEDKNILLYCLKGFIKGFTSSELNQKYQEMIDLEHMQQDIDNLTTRGATEDSQMISIFQSYTEKLKREDLPDLIITNYHLENILDWYLYKLVDDPSPPIDKDVSDLVNLILKDMTLHNQTMLPKTLIIRYFQSVNSSSYSAALNALHNYFDYVLNQYDSASTHTSLLCMTAFHTHFNEPGMAVECFEEAIRVAREERNTETLNMIIMWVMKFIENYPQYSKEFHVKIEQITRFLQSSDLDVDADIFESAYRFDSLFLLREDANLIDLLEASYKYFLIALQNLQPEKDISNALNFRAQLWDDLGFPSLADSYRCSDDTDRELKKGFSSLESNDTKNVGLMLDNMDYTCLTYNNKLDFLRLQIRYLTEINETDEALAKIEEVINKVTLDCSDTHGAAIFELEKVILFHKAGVGMRGQSLLLMLMNHYSSLDRGFYRAKCFLVLISILIEVEPKTSIRDLLCDQLTELLQFSELRPYVDNLLDRIAI